MTTRSTYAAALAAVLVLAALRAPLPWHLVALALVAMIRAMADRARARKEKEFAVARLELRICELQQRSREISLLFDMSETLHLGGRLIDTTGVVASFGQRLFPLCDGAVYVIEPSANVAGLAAWWGTPPELATLGVADCWAMRHSKARGCAHCPGDTSERLCMPMLAFGDLIGVLTLRAQSHESWESIAVVADPFADQIAGAMANVRMQETLRTRAVRDGLTGLFNRRHLEESLTRELHRCRLTGTPVSVILIDVDRFKSFNDTFGHAGGDALLRQFARLMRQVFHQEDMVCRYGGEEFAIMLPDTPIETAIDCANRLRVQVRALEARLDDRMLGAVTISAGVAAAPEHGLDPDKLLDAADRALYRAKENGRDRVITSPPAEVAGRNAA